MSMSMPALGLKLQAPGDARQSLSPDSTPDLAYAGQSKRIVAQEGH